MNLLENTLSKIAPLDDAAMASARERQDTLTKPTGSLGRLEELSIQVAGIQGCARPKLDRKALIIMAADHGVARDNVSAYPIEVTPQMVINFLNGGAAINVLARHVGARVVIVDMGVAAELDHPALISRKVAWGTESMVRGPAMTREQAIQSIESGIEVVEQQVAEGLDIVGTGDMGIGNTATSSAIVATVSGKSPSLVTGRGTGVSDKQLQHKVAVIERSLALNRPDRRDGLDILAKVGGFEIGGLAGVILGAAANRVPVVIDGFISGAAALIAQTICSQARDYMIAAHLSVEIGHRTAMDILGLVPIVDLNMRLGEGTGAALGISIVEASVKTLNEMASFAEAGVSNKE